MSNSYNIETEKIKKELEVELKQIISSAKADLVSSYSELLGDEYVELIDRRQKLGEKYKELIGIAFECATQSGGAELVKKISVYADEEHRRDKDKAKTVYALLDQILDLLEDEYPDLVSLISRAQHDITAVEEEIDILFDLHRAEINQLREKVKNDFREKIRITISNFVDKLADLRRRYRIYTSDDSEVIETVKELGRSCVDNIDDKDDDIIPFKRSKGTLN